MYRTKIIRDEEAPDRALTPFVFSINRLLPRSPLPVLAVQFNSVRSTLFIEQPNPAILAPWGASLF
jgi:hypothetical protein